MSAQLKGPEGRAEIVRLLKDGWELTVDFMPERSRAWMQKDADGDVVEIHYWTFRALESADLVTNARARKGDLWFQNRYKLSAKGRK